MASATSKSAKADENKTTSGSLETDVNQLREDVAELTRLLKRTGGHASNTARKAAHTRTDDLRAQGEAAVEGLRETTRDFEEQFEGAVRRKPLTAVAVAAGVGFLLAVMTRN